MDVEEIVDKVRDYLKDDLDNYAILINGGWGAGKTFLYENYIRKIINENEVGKTDGKRDIYISLYGMSTIQELADELLASYIMFSKLHAQKESKKVLDKAQTVLSMFTKSVKVSIPFVDIDISKFVEESKNLFEINQLVICFDDFERCEIPVNTLFGYINSLVEHQKCKVIILADENNIGKIHANTNVEAKYSTILTGNRKINFVNKSSKQNNNVNDDLTVSQLKNYNEE
ncbi:KAP family P-loop domain-containing protein [Pseudobutyrivibrio sp. UC1225]|uniref:P-loop NTPase fold protein n=1 Tax=Pseudobutyrivibrio sp. UC1225 TaxID=1798185 RepID=UPI0008EAB6EE|nr:P-loop NTPase fold protein [Pseudobutyrivibrio sp. UC1225]SFO29873.1 KAP family P-loop domain-containing protein [Pseudobutyrivibrio sp. UC1225]